MTASKAILKHVKLFDLLKRHNVGQIHRNVLLSNHCSWQIGGPADILIEPGSVKDLQLTLQLISKFDIPVVAIGCGTNLLFDDAGVRGIVVKVDNKMSSYSIEGTRIYAEAGVRMLHLSRAAGKASLTGLEHTIGIPGTIGSLVVMNGGSQRKCIGDVVMEVCVMDHQGQTNRLSRQDCEFSYRSSAIQKSDLIVTKVEMELERGEPRAIRREMLEILRDRNEKFPRKIPNCGSVFVSGGQMYERFGPPGKVIEETGLKGLRIGGAQVSHKHANFIVNLGGATSADILDLIRHVRERVYDRIHVWMECEVRYVSPRGHILSAHQATP